MTQQQHSDTPLFIPGLRPLYEGVAPCIYPLIRFTLGAFLVVHSYPKVTNLSGAAALFGKMGFGSPMALAVLITIVEFFGGLGIALGFITRLWAAAAAIEMAYIVFVLKWQKGFMAFAGGYEYELLLGILLFVIALRGSGNLSVDKAIGKEL